MLERVITRRRGQQRPSDPNEARRGAVKACAADTRSRKRSYGGRKSCRPLSISSTGASTKWATRVKNDLQTLSALTILKARRTEDESARHALFGMAGRIGALSTAYRLVDSTNDERVDASALIKEIAADLVATSEGQPTAVALELEPVAVSAEAAAPLALRADRECASARWSERSRHRGASRGRRRPPRHRGRRLPGA